VLDWGGTGPTLLFLSGLGDSGHEFDDFAPRFTDHFHVIGMTRRGYGRSSNSPTGYDLPTLAHDILQVLDSLHLESVTLVGHSFAGDEMSWFAAHWPDRVNHLVYLDAAHDRSDLAALLSGAHFPPEPPMTRADSASVGALRSYFANETYGVTLPLGWFQSLMQFDASGRYAGPLTPDSLVFVFLSGTRAPDYARIKTPTLAIYAVPMQPEAMFPAYARMSAPDQALADSATVIFRDWGRGQIARVRAELAGAWVLAIPNARHYVFITNEAQVEEAMRRFLNWK
jgi:pimeloyl-ACP methyl ester carboxylesterase